MLTSSCPESMILILGFFLVLIWGSLRFSDAQRINLRSLVYNGENLRGLSWRTKTTNRGQAFGVLAQGLLSQKSFHWMHRYLLTLDAVLDRVLADYIDYLMPDVVDQTGVALRIRPMSYATAMKWLRYCIRVPWKQQTGSRLDPSVFTIHSCKATVLSWSAQQAHLLTEESRLQQGHHRMGSKGSLRLYSRDDVHPALRLQGILRESILQGWRPTVPQHRGSQSALVEPTVGVIEQFSSGFFLVHHQNRPSHHHSGRSTHRRNPSHHHPLIQALPVHHQTRKRKNQLRRLHGLLQRTLNYVAG